MNGTTVKPENKDNFNFDSKPLFGAKNCLNDRILVIKCYFIIDILQMSKVRGVIWK